MAKCVESTTFNPQLLEQRMELAFPHRVGIPGRAVTRRKKQAETFWFPSPNVSAMVLCRKRMVAKLAHIKQQLRRRRHEPIPLLGKWLQQVVTGYYNYHAVPGNLESLSLFRVRLSRLWRRTLRQRGDKRKLDWARFNRICIRYLPSPRTLHPYPHQRFSVTHPR